MIIIHQFHPSLWLSNKVCGMPQGVYWGFKAGSKGMKRWRKIVIGNTNRRMVLGDGTSDFDKLSKCKIMRHQE